MIIFIKRFELELFRRISTAYYGRLKSKYSIEMMIMSNDMRYRLIVMFQVINNEKTSKSSFRSHGNNTL